MYRISEKNGVLISIRDVLDACYDIGIALFV